VKKGLFFYFKALSIIAIIAIIALSAWLPVGTVNAQTAYITNYGDSTVSVINVATNAVATTIKVGKHPRGVSVSPDGIRVYVANNGSNTVSVINAITNTVEATIAVGTNPFGISVSPNNGKVYVANTNDNTVTVINAATNTVAATIPLGYAYDYPYGISVNHDGSKVYVVNENRGSVTVINTATNAVSDSIVKDSNFNFPYGISISPDGSKAYVTNQNSWPDLGYVSVINTAADTVLATIPVNGFAPEGVCVSPDGSKVYVANYDSSKVSVINTVTNTVSATITVGQTPIGISVSPDGSKVYVANTGDGTVSVINAATNTVSATITVGNHPYSLGNFISTYSQLVVTTTHTNGCHDGNSGTATANATGATTPYTYSWNTTPVQTTQTATGLAPGSYTVTVTGANGATQTASATITQPTVIAAHISAQVNTLNCYGDKSGSATVSASGGTPAYTYSWNTTPVQTAATATGLGAGTYTVTVTDANGCTQTATTAAITQPTVITAGISAYTNASGGANNGSATASASGGTPYYSYSWNTSPVQATQTATGLGAGTYIVTVTDANGCTQTANAIIIQLPGVPVLVSPTDTAKNVSITTSFNWQKVTGSTSYHLQIATDSVFTPAAIVFQDSGLTDSTKSGITLVNSTKYYWHVNAKNAGGTGAWSAVNRFTTIIATPGVPVLVSPTDNAANVSITTSLNWQKVTGSTSYRLQIATDSLFATIIVQDSTLTDTIKSSGITLVNNTKYYWRVNSTNAGGTGAWSAVNRFTTIPAIPGVPVLVSPLDNSANVAINTAMNWNKVTGSTSYRLQIATDSLFTAIIAQDSTLTDTIKSSGITLVNGTKYFWHVNATNAGGTGAWSALRRFTTIVAVPAAVTLKLPATSDTVKTDSTILSWSKGTPAVDKYWVEYGADSSFTTTTSDSTVTDTSKMLRSLTDNTNIWWRVSAHNAAGWGTWSAKNVFVVKIPVSGVKQFSAPKIFSFAIASHTGFVKYALPKAENVTLKLYSLKGQLMSEPVDAYQGVGYYSMDLQRNSLAAGSYVVVFKAGEYRVTKMVQLTR